MSLKHKTTKKKSESAFSAETSVVAHVASKRKPRTLKTKKAVKKKPKGTRGKLIPSIFSPRLPISHTDILMSVDVERKGLAAVSKYSGLFFVFLGFAFCSMALGGIYSDGVELSLSSGTTVINRGALRAETISSQVAIEPQERDTDLKGYSGISIEPISENEALMTITAHEATSVTFFATTANILTERYLGKARMSSSTLWNLTQSIDSLPTNTYDVFAKIVTPYGSYVTPAVPFVVAHEFTIASTTANPEFDEVTKTIEMAGAEYDARDPRKDIFTEFKSLPVPASAQPVVSSEATTSSSTSTNAQETKADMQPEFSNIAGLANEYDSKFAQLVTQLSYAVHTQNAYAIEDAKAHILLYAEETKNELMDLLGAHPDSYASGYLDSFSERYTLLAIESMEREVKKQNFILEKVGGEFFVDTDKDILSDYDEYMLNTNPTVADTDIDGFADFYEVAVGTDPLDATNAELTVHASLENAKITALTLDSTINLSIGDENMLSGVGMPGSFVSLYFTGASIISWVKIDNSGVWNYKLSNLDVPEGQYEVVAGFMDSRGVIKALTKPLKFAKTKNGFSSFRPLFHGTTEQFLTTSVFSENLLMLGYALTVLILGVCLILLGLHLSYHSFRRSPIVVGV